MRLGWLFALALLTASVAGGCDPGYVVWFRNDSSTPVLVQFIDRTADAPTGTGFLVGAESVGGSYASLGPTTWSAQVRVVVPEGCRLLWQKDVQASPSGAVVVDSSGGVTIVTSGVASVPAASEIPIPAASETKLCLPPGTYFMPTAG